MLRTDILNVDFYDFEYLREWRIKGNAFDFSKFPQGDIIVVAPDTNSLNHLVVKFDMKFTPYVNCYTGDIEEDWSEEFVREWKFTSGFHGVKRSNSSSDIRLFGCFSSNSFRYW